MFSMIRVWPLVALAACRFGFMEQPPGSLDDSGAPPDELGFSLDATILPDGVSAPACPTTLLLEDEFEIAGAAPDFFSYTSNGVTVREQNGRFEVVFGANVGDGRYAGYKSAAGFAPEGLCGVTKIAEVPASNGMAFFKLWSMQQQVEFTLYQGFLRARTHLNNSVAELLMVQHDPVGHAYLRLRQQGGVTYWDVSSDGVSFTALVETTFLTASNVQYELGAGSYGTSTNAGVAGFEWARLYGP